MIVPRIRIHEKIGVPNTRKHTNRSGFPGISSVSICFICGQILNLCSFASAALGATGKPNIVLVMTDDQGWFDVGVHGNTAIETPVMDRFAGEGVEFTRFYASPVCTPTRASLLTGRYYHRTGAVDTFRGHDTMDAGETTLGQVLQKAGYRTGLFGKWHVGRYMRYHPNLRGFDEFFGFWQYGFINHYDDSEELFHNRQPVLTTGYITDVLTDQAIEFVRASRDRPFFLYVPYNAPHDPHLVSDTLIDKYLKKGLPLREARIYGMITRIDENLGRLLKAIDDERLADNTIFIFMTDNGGVSTWFKAGLRANKGTVYEGGIRVPLFMRWPGKFKPGLKIDARAQHIDLLPTLCELIGAPLPTQRPLDGVSLAKLIRDGGGPDAREYLFHHWTRHPLDRQKNWAVHHGDYKMVNGELFNLVEDPGETKNIADQHADMAAKLQKAFDAWYQDVTAGQTYERVPIEVGREDENPVEIDVEWGEVAAKSPLIRYVHYNRSRIDNWTDPQGAVRWKIDVTRAGRYQVELFYGCRPGDEGSRFRMSVGDVHLDGQVQATARQDVYQPFVIGSMDLPAGRAMLEMKPLQIAGKELMVLHKILLRRIP